MRPRGPSVRMKRPPLDMEELARSLPGGQGPQHGIQASLRHVLSYIEFLQTRIRDTQDMLVPHSSLLGFRPLWTPRHSLSSSGKTGKCHLNARRRCQPIACAESPEPDSEPGAGQKLVPYFSSSSSESGDPGPWMVSVTVSPRPPLSPGTPQSMMPSFLGLSPSLCSSPVDDVVPPVLFQEVQICCSSPTQGCAVSSPLSLDHSYQSQKGLGAGVLGPRTSSQQDGSQGEEQRSDTNGGQEPKRRRPGSVTKSRARSKARRGTGKPPAGAGNTGKPPDSSGEQPIRKKCVNGFIMFCRLNRRAYLRANPGTASTKATRHLAELWRTMSVQERRPYCVKALQFSLTHDRLVKPVRNLHRDTSPPKPLSVLLAGKAFRPVTP